MSMANLGSGMPHQHQHESINSTVIGQLQHLDVRTTQEQQAAIFRALQDLDARQQAEDGDHWWHTYSDADAAYPLLALLVQPAQQGEILRLKTKLLSSLGWCPQCVVAYHNVKTYITDRISGGAKVLSELQQWDEERVSTALRRAALNAADDITQEAITALFEVLSFESLMNDAEVMGAIESALLALNEHHDLALTEGGRYPGIYRLLAHGSQKLRSLVRPIVRTLGTFEDEPDVEGIMSVLRRWLHALEFDLFEEQLAEDGRPRWLQPRQTLWQALNSILGLMGRLAMLFILHQLPALVNVIVNFACDGSAISWPALGCLKSIFQSAKAEALPIIQMVPEALIDRLATVAMQTLDARLQAHIISALKALALALLSPGRQASSDFQRRRILSVFLKHFPGTPFMNPATSSMAERAALQVVTEGLTSGGTVAEESHIFGPSLCRLLHKQGEEEEPNLPIGLHLCAQLLERDAQTLAVVNQALQSDLQSREESQKADAPPRGADWLKANGTVAPALWKGLVGSPHLQVSSILISAAASLAHVTAAQAKSSTRGDVGFHGNDAGALQRIHAAMEWPALNEAYAFHPNPLALRAAEAPGLLLQALRQATTDHLACNVLHRSAFQAASDSQKTALISSLVQLMVGVHSPLRATSETALLEILEKPSREDAIGALLWSPGLFNSAFVVLTKSMQLLSSISPAQAMVRADTQALLSLILELLTASEDLGQSISTARSGLAVALWKFLLGMLKRGLQVARVNVAVVSLQRAFDLLPIAWQLGSADPLQGRPAARDMSRQEARNSLEFMTDAFWWGAACSQAVIPNWMNAIHTILLSLPDTPERCLPSEALKAATEAMESDNAIPDKARLLLGPLLKQTTFGNVGLNPLSSLPSRSRLALPTVPSMKAGRPLPSAPSLPKKTAHPFSAVNPKQDSDVIVDLTLDDSNKSARLRSSIQERRVSAEVSTIGNQESYGNVPDWMLAAPVGKLGEPTLEESGGEATGYDSATPFGEVLASQQALWDASTRSYGKLQSGRGPDRAAKLGRGQKSISSFVSVSPHKKGDPKLPPPQPRQLSSGIDMDSVWADFKKAEATRAAEKAVREVKRQGKATGHSRLKAMMEKADAEERVWERRVPRAERTQPNLGSLNKSRKDSRSATPEPAVQKRGNSPASSAALQEVQNLEEGLQLHPQQTAARPLPDKRARLGLPAVPKAVRKVIQLADAPGISITTAARQRAAAAAVSQQRVLSMEEVQNNILGWNFYDIISGKATRRGLQLVPTYFDSLEEYSRTFWALLLEELRAHIQQAHEEGNVGSVPLLVHSVQRRSLLHRVELLLNLSDREGCRYGDLLLLTQSQPDSAAGRAAQPPAVHLLALVNSVEDDEKGSTRVQKRVAANVNLLPSTEEADPKRFEIASKTLLEGTTWYATRLLSWTPHHREFQALCRAHLLPKDLLGQLLHPQPPVHSRAPKLLTEQSLPGPLTRALQAAYNSSQQAAIAACAAGDGQFTLVQGPPGTGKTSTVIGIISAILALPAEPSEKSQVPGSNPQQPSRAANFSALARSTAAAQMLAQPPEKAETRVLVCAQSNAAVDELVMRLVDPGIFGLSGQRRVPEMVRFGKMESAHESIRSFHIDAVAERYNNSGNKAQPVAGSTDDKGKQEIRKLQQQLQAARAALDKAEARQGEDDASDAAATKALSNLGALKDTRRRLALQLKAAKEQAQRRSEEHSRARTAVRKAVIKAAEVVACTLSSAGGDLLALSAGSIRFQALIIDEAAQALEPAAQIGLQLLAPGARIVLVGDPKQLPATVLSKAAEAANLTQSLFERLQQAGWPVTMLSEQYRMHPQISAWPAAFFYDGRLEDGQSVKAGGCSADFHSRTCFPPLAVFDCRDGREGTPAAGGRSLSNASEADLVCALLSGLVKSFPGALEGTVAVLTPYRAQLDLLRSRMAKALKRESLKHIEFATVDGFQGKEADIVVFSCVRARAPRQSSSVGFLADVRRMNVALTRARRGLWIVGHTETLKLCPPWAALLAHSQKHNCLFAAPPPYSSLLTATRETLLGRPQITTAAKGRATEESTVAPSRPDAGPKRKAVNISRHTIGLQKTGAADVLLLEADRRAKKTRVLPRGPVMSKQKSTDAEVPAAGLPERISVTDVLTAPREAATTSKISCSSLRAGQGGLSGPSPLPPLGSSPATWEQSSNPSMVAAVPAQMTKTEEVGKLPPLPLSQPPEMQAHADPVPPPCLEGNSGASERLEQPKAQQKSSRARDPPHSDSGKKNSKLPRRQDFAADPKSDAAEPGAERMSRRKQLTGRQPRNEKVKREKQYTAGNLDLERLRAMAKRRKGNAGSKTVDNVNSPTATSKNAGKHKDENPLSVEYLEAMSIDSE